MTQSTDRDPFFGNVISTYTRAQAIEDGVLIDAGPWPGRPVSNGRLP